MASLSQAYSGPNLLDCEIGGARLDAEVYRCAQPPQLLLGGQGVPARELVGAHDGFGLDVIDDLCVHIIILPQLSGGFSRASARRLDLGQNRARSRRHMVYVRMEKAEARADRREPF